MPVRLASVAFCSVAPTPSVLHGSRTAWTGGFKTSAPRRRPRTRTAPCQPPRHCASWRMASTSTDSGLAAGLIVEYSANSGLRRLGCTLRPDGKRNWILEDSDGATQSVSMKQITFVYGPSESGSLTLAEAVSRTQAECEARVEENSELLDIAWEYVSSRDSEDGGTSTTLEEVSELVFDDTSADSLYAVHVMLERDKLLFRKKVIKGTAQYEAKSPALVEEARVTLQAEQERLAREQAKLESIVRSFREKDPELVKAEYGEEAFAEFADVLEVIALEYANEMRAADYATNAASGFNLLDAKGKAAASTVLGAVGLPLLPVSAFNVLVAWGIFVPHENLAFRRAGLGELFGDSDEISSAVEILLRGGHAAIEDVDAGYRRDLTHLVSYAVDSADTDEVDDAISWDAENKMAWVHIADPTRYFPDGLDNPIVKAALKRALTIYLPTGKHTMFPGQIASSMLSLGGSMADNCALSFGFALQDDGEIDKSKSVVTASYVQSPIRMTYEEVEEVLLVGDSSVELNVLFEFAKKRIAFREEDGAVNVPSPFSRVKVANPDAEEPEIHLSLIETDSKSWALVSELMIAACGIAGDFGEKEGLVLPYRGQEPFDVPFDEDVESIPAGPARVSAYFREATPSMVKLEPSVHASLALDAYVQVTSPIRRSSDLLAHFQIKAALRTGAGLLDEECMRSEVSRSGEGSRALRTVDQGTSKYWQLEHLRRLGPEFEHEAVYVRPLRDNDRRLGLVHIKQSGLQLVANIVGNAKLGSDVSLRVSSANPRALASRSEATVIEAKPEVDESVVDLFSVIDSDEETESLDTVE